MISLLIAASLLMPAHATTASPPPEQTVEATVSTTTETLPEDGIRYQWERFRFWAQRALTFNADRKAELYEQHLEKLDNRLEACTEKENTKCVERIQAHMQKLQKRAEKFIEKRTEIREKYLERFNILKERRHNRVEDMQRKMLEKDDVQRGQNAEKIIELRSHNLKNKLDNTQEKVRLKQQEFNQQLSQ